MKKIIIIKDCMSCPYIVNCKSWKKLSPKQRFVLKTRGVGIGEFILKDCELKTITDEQIEELRIENKGN